MSGEFWLLTGLAGIACILVHQPLFGLFVVGMSIACLATQRIFEAAK